jgi:CBS domain-containing protein
MIRDVLDHHATQAALIVDDDRNVVGTVLRADLAEHGGIAGDVMRPDTPRVRESAPLAVAIAPMAYGRSRVIAVIRDDGHFVGVLTEIDVLRWIARGGTR